MQLDADEDGQPFFKPPAFPSGPNPLLAPSPQQQTVREQGSTVAPESEVVHAEHGSVSAVAAAAATATVEQEE